MTNTILKEETLFAAAAPIVEALRSTVDLIATKDGLKWQNIVGLNSSSVRQQAQNFEIAKSSRNNSVQAIENFAESVDAFLHRLNSDPKLCEGNEAALDDISKWLEELKRVPDESVSAFSSGLVTKSYFTRALSLQQQLNELQSRLYSVNAQIETLSEKSDQAIKVAQKAIEELSEKINFETASLIKPIEEKAKEVEEKYTSVILSLAEKNAQVTSLISAASGTAMALSHIKDAREQKQNADYFRKITIAYTLAITLIAAFVLAEFWSHDFNMPMFFSRLTFLFFLSVPSAYFAREANKHRIQENLSKKTALDLLAIDPYIHGMDKDAINKIKADLAPRIFFATSTVVDTENSQNEIMSFLNAVLKKISKDK